MYQIDKKAFGAFVAALRKETGMTQKELASRLFVSDKAVSKWETGASIPDTALLLPLAQLLGVSVTELLRGQRLEEDRTLEAGEVENLVQAAISYPEGPQRGGASRGRWGLCWLLCLLGGGGLLLALWMQGQTLGSLSIAFLLSAIFGVYFCFFVPMRLPDYYDQHSISSFSDGPVRINMWGLRFHNRNWPHIVRVLRIWTCLSLVGIPAGGGLFVWLAPAFWQNGGYWVTLVVYLCSLFLPLWLVGKKYE